MKVVVLNAASGESVMHAADLGEVITVRMADALNATISIVALDSDTVLALLG
jgi:hypothetical protein